MAEQTPSIMRAVGLEKKNGIPDASESLGPVIEVDNPVNMPLSGPDSAFDKPLAERIRERMERGIASNNCSPIRSQSQAEVDVDTKTSSDAAIPYIDGDDDGAVASLGNHTGKQELSEDNVMDEQKDVVCKNTWLPASPTSVYDNSLWNAASQAVSADLNENGTEMVEYPEQHNQRQRVPPSTTFGDAFGGQTDSADENQSQWPSYQLGQRRGSGSQDAIPKDYEEHGNGNTDAEKRNGTGRTTRTARRKQREAKSVKKSDDIDGFRGHESVEALVAYIEGPDAAKKVHEQGGKRAKKKSGSSGEHGNPSQKKGRTPSPNDTNFTSGSPTPPSSLERQNNTAPVNTVAAIAAENFKKSDSATCPKRPDDIGNIRAVEPEGDAALAARLQMEELALRNNDLMPTVKGNDVDEKEKFVPVLSRKPKPPRPFYSDRVFTASKAKNKRCATPPPPSTRKEASPALPDMGRQRRNSYDFSFAGNISNAITAFASAKDASVSSTSTYSCRVKAAAGNTSDATTFISQTFVDNADSEFANVSFSSADGDAATAVKMSYANVAAAVACGRSNQAQGNTKDTQEKGFKEETPLSDTVDFAQPNIPKTSATTESASSVDTKSPFDFPSLVTAASAIDVAPKGASANVEKRLGECDKVVLLPPAKVDMGRSAEGMDFVFDVSADAGSKAFPEKIDGALANDNTDQRESLTGVAGSGTEMLQMLFDSCRNGEGGAVVVSEQALAASCQSMDEDSGPAVQFLGIPAPQADSINISFFVDENADDEVINAVLKRSRSVGARPTNECSMNTSIVSVKSESNAIRGENNDFAIGEARKLGKPKAKVNAFNQQTYKDMVAFAKEAWEAFAAGGNIKVYNPRQDEVAHPE